MVGFFICWAPFHAQRLVAMYGLLDEHPSKTVFIVYIFLTYLSGVLYYLSTTINPLLYHIMSHKFRNAFKVSNEMFRIKRVDGDAEARGGAERSGAGGGGLRKSYSRHFAESLNLVSYFHRSFVFFFFKSRMARRVWKYHLLVFAVFFCFFF